MKYFFGLLILIGFACENKPEAPLASGIKNNLDSTNSSKQNTNPYAGIDISPMDMSYMPVDYPKLAVKKALPTVRLIYSRPHKQGRKLYGALIKYGEPWRLGANEATEIEIFETVIVQDKKIAKGKYVLYAIPQQDKWTIVFNTNLNSWGLNIDTAKDIHRFDILVDTKAQSIEYFTMAFQNTSTGADLIIAWDNAEARLPFKYTEK